MVFSAALPRHLRTAQPLIPVSPFVFGVEGGQAVACEHPVQAGDDAL
jgi:hypothetical protein